MRVKRLWFAFWWDRMLERWSSYGTERCREDALAEARDLRARGHKARVGWESWEAPE